MEEVFDFLKSFVPFSFILAIPMILFVLPITSVNGAQNFVLYRTQPFNFYSQSPGISATEEFGTEIKTLRTWSGPLHCVLTRLKDLSTERALHVLENAGALLIMLPKDPTLLLYKEIKNSAEVEQFIMLLDIKIPLYFMTWDIELENLIDKIDEGSITAMDRSVLEIAWKTLFSYGYLARVYDTVPFIQPNTHLPVIYGVLSPETDGQNLPTIMVVTYYDSLGIVPKFSFGVDSNGSGMAVFFELMRIFSKLYASEHTVPNYNMVFLLTGGGKMNFMGSKKWLDFQLEPSASDNKQMQLLSNVALIVCLDALGAGSQLFVHTAKAPKEGGTLHQFVEKLNSTADGKLSMTVKKLSVSDHKAAWEHERFVRKRLPALTVSSLEDPGDWKRSTIFDLNFMVDKTALLQNAVILSEGLAAFIYNQTVRPVIPYFAVKEESLKATLDFVTRYPRHMALCDENKNIVNSLYNLMKSHLPVVNMTYYNPSKKNPDFVFWDVQKARIQVYNVKPAPFDLFLTLIIGCYLLAVYFTIEKFPLLYQAIDVGRNCIQKKIR